MDSIPQDIKKIFAHFVISLDNKLPIYINREILEWLEYRGDLTEKHVRFLNDLHGQAQRNDGQAQRNYFYYSDSEYKSKFLPIVHTYVNSDALIKINNPNGLNPQEKYEIVDYFAKYVSIEHHLLVTQATFQKYCDARPKLREKFNMIKSVVNGYGEYKRQFIEKN
jgi:hypothetical protein